MSGLVTQDIIPQVISMREASLMTDLEDAAEQLNYERWRPTFDVIAKREGVDERALDDLWRHAAIDISKQPDQGVMEAAIASVKTARPYLFPPVPAPEVDPLEADLLPDDAPLGDVGWSMRNNDLVVKDAVARQKLGRPRPMYQD